MADGERRHITVMFCDLVGSTSMSGTLDPEELQEIIRAFQEACASAIETNGGYVAHYMGDGILAYFGFPVADEQASVNAVRAGLQLVEAVRERAVDIPGLAVRVGVHSGITVVADMGAGRQRQINDVVGETPNIAARVQSVAEPGTVVVSDVVKQACEGYIELRSLGAHELKGVNRPIELHQAITDTGAANRLDAAVARHGLTPLVGRSTEMELLMGAWRRTQMRDGQVVWIRGEPGIGKSRLVRELVNRVRADGGIEIDFRCSMLHQSSSLYPSAEQFRRFVMAQCGELSLAGVEALADQNGTPRGLAVPVVADLLGIPLVPPYQAVDGSADRIRHHTLDVLERLIADRATRQPILVVIDDLQWMDQTSLELAERFIGPDQRTDVMTVVTYRSDFEPGLPMHAHHQRLLLERLRSSDVRAIIEAVAGDANLTAGMIEQISSRTEGVPLFAEELTKLLADASYEDSQVSVPLTLRDSLMARLDRLGPESDVLRRLSVIGREATEGLLVEISGLDRSTFGRYLDRLLDTGILLCRGRGPLAVYSFKHPLLAEVVYESMLRSTRQKMHARVAEALESRFVERTIMEPEMSARHFELAGDPRRSLTYLLRAGDRAIAISAHAEALHHLQHALELVEQLPEGTARDVQEISVLVKLGVPTTATIGYGSPEAEAIYARAEDLCDRVGEDAPVFPALYGLYRTRLLRAEYEPAEAIARRLEALAAADPTRLAFTVGAHRALGSVFMYLGRDHREALDHLQAAMGAPDSDRPGAYLGDLNDVVDPVITCRSYAGWAHWLMGDAKRAREMSNDAITAARRLAHPFTLSLALCFDAWLCQFEGDVDATAARALEAREQALAHGFPFWVGWADVLHSWSRLEKGDPEAVAGMRAGIEAWQAQGSKLGKTYFLGLVGQGEAALGQFAAAEQTLIGAAELADAIHEHFWLPELLRARAEVARSLGRPLAEVDQLLTRAETIATAQGGVALLERIEASRAEC